MRLPVLSSAVRSLGRRPALAVTAVSVLALGIGSATAMFGVVDAVLLRPLPFPGEERVILVQKRLSGDGSIWPFQVADLELFRDRTRTFAAVGGVQYDGVWPMPAELDGEPLLLTVAAVSGDFFAVLGMRPAAGRLLR
ncbi:MAG: ABC transporter permease, partial [Longimicrobiales bacterium]